MSATSPLSALTLKKRLKPTLSHLEALVELLPAPTLIIDRRTERILLANSRIVELTAFTRLELADRSLSALLPNLREILFHPQPGAFTTTLLHRSGPGQLVYASTAPLDSSDQLTVITLETATALEARQAAKLRHERRLAAFSMLAASFHQPDLPSAFTLALQAGALLTGSSILALYQVEGPDFDLTLQASHGPVELLPNRLPSQEMMVLKTPTLWTPRRRAASALHRAARLAQLTLVASTPLGEEKAAVGLLVAAGDHTVSSDEITPLLHTLASALTALLQTHALSTNLFTQLTNLTRELSLASAVHSLMQEGLVTLAADLTIASLNPAAEAILGYGSAEILGLPYQNILIGADHIIPPFAFSDTRAEEYTLKNVRLYRRTGASFLANLRAVPVLTHDHLDYLAIIIQDLSQEEQYRIRNQQLEQRALIGEVSAIFAHEVRNPLNSISTGLDLIELNLPPQDPNQEVVARLRRDVTRLEDLMKSTLAFVRPMQYKMEPLAVQESLPRLVERWRSHLTRAHIKADLQIDPNTPLILGDHRALEQVWNNLISNAIQAMSASGGTLTVIVRHLITPENLPRVEIIISDTGCGIPDEVKEKIFEPFFTTNASGTGLGLPIAKNIITTHRGSIQVTSVPGGTSFQILIPTANS
jgi:two-component system, NtrC family, sensor histidine kinase AtoS